MTKLATILNVQRHLKAAAAAARLVGTYKHAAYFLPSGKPTGEVLNEPQREAIRSRYLSSDPAQPSPTTQPATQPATRPVAFQGSRPTPQPATQPTQQPATRPAAQPASRPSTTRPTTRPTPWPTTRPATRPVTRRPTAQVTSPQQFSSRRPMTQRPTAQVTSPQQPMQTGGTETPTPQVSEGVMKMRRAHIEGLKRWQREGRTQGQSVADRHVVNESDVVNGRSVMPADMHALARATAQTAAAPGGSDTFTDASGKSINAAEDLAGLQDQYAAQRARQRALRVQAEAARKRLEWDQATSYADADLARLTGPNGEWGPNLDKKTDKVDWVDTPGKKPPVLQPPVQKYGAAQAAADRLSQTPGRVIIKEPVPAYGVQTAAGVWDYKKPKIPFGMIKPEEGVGVMYPEDVKRPLGAELVDDARKAVTHLYNRLSGR